MVDHYSSQSSSPCDSLLGPLNGDKMLPDLDMFGDVLGFMQREKLLQATAVAVATPEQTQLAEDTTTCPEPTPSPSPLAPTAPAEIQLQEEAAATAIASTACSPRCPLLTRTHRPSLLTLTRTNGLTTISTPDLRRSICDARTAPDATRFQTQVPRPRADQHVPPTPGTPSPLFIMGNNASSLVEPPADDGASSRSSVVRRAHAPMRMLRKTSANLLPHAKRHGFKPSPPPKLTSATFIQVQQQPSLNSLAATPEESDEDAQMGAAQNGFVSHDSCPENAVRVDTTTNLNVTHPPPETSTTSHVQSNRENRDPRKQSKSESDLRKRSLLQPNSALSPTIPAPSPLPQDSPHKYGLKDRVDTPELQEVPKLSAIEPVVSARRRSSGLEIFHEAKSLQSASSFLNGLSTSRRRAESLQRSSESALTSQPTARRTTGPKQRSLLPVSAQKSNRPLDRCRGDNFKPSGFAYARPLAPAQLKCYRNHMRLLPSSNKRCPVECAVCHIDDDREHFTCSWCALRMCHFCRKEFAEKGIGGLRERIRQAELSSESEGDGQSVRGMSPPRSSAVVER